MATIADVARQAGVAPSTVSHALSGKRPVAAATRERIVVAARELGYEPNATVGNVRARAPRAHGLSLPHNSPARTLSHGPFAKYVAAIADLLAAHDYILLCLVARSPEASDLARLVRGGHVDGLILLPVRLDDPRVHTLRTDDLPFASIGRPRETRGIVYVDADQRTAATMAVAHLVALGHRHLAFLGHEPVFGFQYHAPHGFGCAHRAHGLPLHRSQILHDVRSTGLRRVLESLVGHDGPTALVTTTDIEAVTALHVLADRGRRVPADVSLVTLGDSMLAVMACHHGITIRTETAGQEWTPRR
jgi:DNA-binding LacI/PurR family transcriptional regulator